MTATDPTTRRRFLQLGAGAWASTLWPGCTGDAPEDLATGKPPVAPPAEWRVDARVAALTAAGASNGALRAALDQLAHERVSVVRIDVDLSRYATDQEFADQVTTLDRLAQACQQRGMRAVALYPALQVLTPDGDRRDRTMAKEHPGWLQQGLDGRVARAIVDDAGTAQLPRGTETAWMCPTSGYREYFLGRLRLLARTSLDGVWLDAPLLSNFDGGWACVNDSCANRFRADTRLALPARVDWANATFRRWVLWRQQIVWRFEQDALGAVSAERPGFVLITEAKTTDYDASTHQRIADLPADPGEVIRAWNVQPVSATTGMRRAAGDDWLSMGAMMRTARGLSTGRPSWVICPGSESDDAERVMALAILAGHAPLETGLRAGSVGSSYRERMFRWIAEHGDLFRAASTNAALVLYSSTSRAFLDRDSGVGLYTSLRPDDPAWWSRRPEDLASAVPYAGDFRGVCKALVGAQAPFEVMAAQRFERNAASRYRLVVVPSAVSLTDEANAEIAGWTREGGVLVITGNDTSLQDDLGNRRFGENLMSRVGVLLRDGELQNKPYGRGHVVFIGARAGLALLRGEPTPLTELIVEAADRAKVRVVTDAPPGIWIDQRRTADRGQRVCLFANLVGLGEGERFGPTEARFSVSLPFVGPAPTAATWAAPGQADRPLTFAEADGLVTFDVNVGALGAAIFRTEVRDP